MLELIPQNSPQLRMVSSLTRDMKSSWLLNTGRTVCCFLVENTHSSQLPSILLLTKDEDEEPPPPSL